MTIFSNTIIASLMYLSRFCYNRNLQTCYFFLHKKFHSSIANRVHNINLIARIPFTHLWSLTVTGKFIWSDREVLKELLQNFRSSFFFPERIIWLVWMGIFRRVYEEASVD